MRKDKLTTNKINNYGCCKYHVFAFKNKPISVTESFCFDEEEKIYLIMN